MMIQRAMWEESPMSAMSVSEPEELLEVVPEVPAEEPLPEEVSEMYAEELLPETKMKEKYCRMRFQKVSAAGCRKGFCQKKKDFVSASYIGIFLKTPISAKR